MNRVFVLLAVLAITGCVDKNPPATYNVDDPIPRWDQSLPLDRIEALIVASCTNLGWKTRHVADGHLVAIQERETFSATVDILFDHQHWQIQYQTSVGLLSQTGYIHGHYSLWIRTLEHEIQSLFNSTLPIGGRYPEQ